MYVAKMTKREKGRELRSVRQLAEAEASGLADLRAQNAEEGEALRVLEAEYAEVAASNFAAPAFTHREPCTTASSSRSSTSLPTRVTGMSISRTSTSGSRTSDRSAPFASAR